MNKKCISWIIGIVLFFSLSSLVPKPTCKDGWRSPSIGRSGACSHHGGVRKSPWGLFVIILSIGGGVLTNHILKPTTMKKPKNSDSPYGSINEHETLLRKSGVDEKQIKLIIENLKKDE